MITIKNTEFGNIHSKQKAVKFNQIMVKQCPLVSWYFCLG